MLAIFSESVDRIKFERIKNKGKNTKLLLFFCDKIFKKLKNKAVLSFI